MLRNVESFWCPIRFSCEKKCANCAIDFPDVNQGWVHASGKMSDVVKTLDRLYPPAEQVQTWFGHPLRKGHSLTSTGKPESRARSSKSCLILTITPGVASSGSILESDLASGPSKSIYAVSLNRRPRCKSPTSGRTEVEQGLILTSNAMGIMTREPAPVALKFAEHAGRAQCPVLEIGAAYGNASYPALEAGGTVIACDLAEDELAQLRAPVPREMQKRLITIPARFPEQLHFTAGSLSAVLAAQVLHFFDGPAVQSALATVFRWLEPSEGRLYLVVMTPQLSYYVKFLPEFQRRKGQGDPWPGTFDPRLVATPDWRDRLPPLVNLFDADILRRAVQDAGFVIEHLEPFCYRDFPEKHRTNGQEFLGLVARKP